MRHGLGWPAAWSRRWWWVLGAALLAAATVAAWVAASQARTPAQRAADADAPSPSTITVEVESGQLVDELVLQGTVTRRERTTVPGPGGTAEGAQSVVTALPLAPGDTVYPGTVLAEVSGRPVIALPGDFPAYRELDRGMSGPDVRQLQRALQPRWGTPVTGTFDVRTEQDVRRMYESAGYQPVERELPREPAQEPQERQDSEDPDPSAAPSGSPPPASSPPPPETAPVVPAREIAYLAQLPATVTAGHVEVGDDGSGPLLDVASGRWQVEAPLGATTDVDLSGLSGDGEIVFRDGPLAGTEATFEGVRAPAQDGGEQDQEGGEPAGDPGGDPGDAEATTAVFGIAGDVDDLTADQPQPVVVERARSPDDAVIVPLSALWTEADSSAVVRVVADDGTTREVPVEVTVTVAGEAAVRPVAGDGGAALAEGDEVAVGYEDAPDG